MTGAHDILASFFTLAGDTKLEILGGTEISPHDLRRRIEVAAAAGYTGFGFAEKDLRHWTQRYSLPEIHKILDDSGIRVVELENLSGWHVDGERRLASDRLQAELLEWAAVLGVRHIKVCADLSGAPCEHGKLVEEFGRLCEDAARVGPMIALEPMPFGAIATPKAGLAIIEESGAENAGLVLDVWHVNRSGTGYDELRSIPGARIASVELMDAAEHPVDGDLVKDGSDYRRVAGTGGLRVEAFTDAVLSTGYGGPFGDENLSIAMRESSLQDAATTSYRAVRDLVNGS